ncbi:MAG: pentapeptide repeat-containing protein [Deltaproteobacteria bacterium]|nr:pentapeptide repeat-containing protein [Deltaproteobacteria bacterium]
MARSELRNASPPITKTQAIANASPNIRAIARAIRDQRPRGCPRGLADLAVEDSAVNDVVLDGSMLEGCVLEGCVLEGSVLEGSVLEGSMLEGSMLEGSVAGRSMLDTGTLGGSEPSDGGRLFGIQKASPSEMWSAHAGFGSGSGVMRFRRNPRSTRIGPTGV